MADVSAPLIGHIERYSRVTWISKCGTEHVRRSGLQKKQQQQQGDLLHGIFLFPLSFGFHLEKCTSTKKNAET